MPQAIAKLVARRSRGVLLSLNLGFAQRHQMPVLRPDPDARLLFRLPGFHLTVISPQQIRNFIVLLSPARHSIFVEPAFQYLRRYRTSQPDAIHQA